MNIDKINDVNKCIDYLESGVVLKVKITDSQKTINISSQNELNLPCSVVELYNIAKEFKEKQKSIVEICI